MFRAFSVLWLMPFCASAVHAEDFDSLKPGQFSTLVTSIGRWQVERGGVALIDNQHSVSGKQCLHLTGGKRTAAILTLPPGSDTSGDLVFRAERWTRRAPFVFRIDKQVGAGWQEIYNGDAFIRVGRPFLSHVKVRLGDRNIRQLRFTVESPIGTGILIDDLRLTQPRPMKIVSVEHVPWTAPVLVGRGSCGLSCLKVEAEGNLKPVSLDSITSKVSCDGNDVAQVQACLSTEDRFATARPKGLTVALSKDAEEQQAHTIQLFPDAELTEGTNYVWVACTLRTTADIDRQVTGSVSQLSFSNGQNFALKNASGTQRFGIALRKGGDDGVHTYRIPGLTTTTKGTLIGVYDVRRRSGGDLPGDIDVGMSRSVDGGRTWEPMQIIMDMGDDPKWNYDGVGDPAVLVDEDTNTIWVAATWSHGNRSWRGSGQGLSPEQTGQLMLVRSDDDGKTWSKPINITEQVKSPDWCFILQGPGKGITMQDGTLVFAAQYQDPPEKKRLPHSTIIYSRDHGRTWSVGTGAFDDTTESQVVEVSPGVLMLNCRYNREGTRVVMTTRDMGKTWQKHQTSQRSLIEPGACMASLIDVDQELGAERGGWMLFSNPDSRRARERIMIKASSDGGLTWPKQHRLLLDAERGGGYSCMTMIDRETVGILYEGSQADMTFQRIPLSEVIGPKPPVARRPKPALGFAQVFGNGMVLQNGVELPVWGTAPPDSEVFVTLGGEDRMVESNHRGEWMVAFPPRQIDAAGITMTLSTGKRTIRLTDILVGEVWLCAGQSNMEWPLRQTVDGTAEIASAADRRHIRLLNLVGAARGSSGVYTAAQLERLTPSEFCAGTWQTCSSQTVPSFSAAGWYFGRKLNSDLNAPIGLISPAIGGTPTEAWIPERSLRDNPNTRELVAGNWLDNVHLGEFCRTRGLQNLLPPIQAGESVPGDDSGPNHSFKPGFMWAAGIEPVAPFPIKGVLWYQGESNAETDERVMQHDTLFPMLVHSVRGLWEQADLPLLFVQLPALKREAWPLFRDRQRRLAAQLPGVEMAVTIDTGHPTDVHPHTKRPVGERLAQLALSRVYQHAGAQPDSGPGLQAAEREDSAVVVRFANVGDGLKTVDGKPVRHFEVCGDDNEYFPAVAQVTGKNTLRVTCAEVNHPAAIRYAWIPFPEPPVNLTGSSGLPASPFMSNLADGQ